MHIRRYRTRGGQCVGRSIFAANMPSFARVASHNGCYQQLCRTGTYSALKFHLHDPTHLIDSRQYCGGMAALPTNRGNPRGMAVETQAPPEGLENDIATGSRSGSIGELDCLFPIRFWADHHF